MTSEVPSEVRDAARRAFASRDRGAQVLDLEVDSLLQPDGAADPRRLVFGAAPGPRLEVAVHGAGTDRVRLEVRCDAPGCDVLEVRTGSEQVPVASSGDAGWTAGPAAHGLLTVMASIGDKRFQTAAVRV